MTAPIARIVFVCQTGEIELQGVLLAASLRQHLPQTQLIAAHPIAHGGLSSDTLAALKDLRVDLAEIVNPLDPDYPIGNKLAAMALLQGDGPGLFLDSDSLALQPPLDAPAGLGAVPANAQHCGIDVWRAIYDHFRIGLPDDPPATLLTEQKTAPYYTTGCIAIDGQAADAFAEAWIDCALRLDVFAALPGTARCPYLDQISFPIAAACMGLKIETLSECWNFQNWRRRHYLENSATFFHYGDFFRLPYQDFSLARARQARASSPAVERALAGIQELAE